MDSYKHFLVIIHHFHYIFQARIQARLVGQPAPPHTARRAENNDHHQTLQRRQNDHMLRQVVQQGVVSVTSTTFCSRECWRRDLLPIQNNRRWRCLKGR